MTGYYWLVFAAFKQHFNKYALRSEHMDFSGLRSYKNSHLMVKPNFVPWICQISAHCSKIDLETWVSLPFNDICMLCHDSDYLLCIHSGLEKFSIRAGQAFESWEYKHIWINPRAKLQSQPESSMIEHVGQLIKLTHGIVTAWIYLPLIYVHVILNIIINSDGYSWQ